MSSVQCSQCQRWFSNHRNLMFHMASCPAKYSNNDDTLELLGHNPLKSSYDLRTSTNIAVPCINDDTAFLFEVERNEIEGIDDDLSSQLSTDDSDSDTDSPYDPYDNDYDEESCNPQALEKYLCNAHGEVGICVTTKEYIGTKSNTTEKIR